MQYLALLLILFFPAALTAELFEHSPPVLTLDTHLADQVLIRVESREVEKARILIATPSGLKAKPMQKIEGGFEFNLDFSGYKKVAYRFQYKGEEGIGTTSWFQIEEPEADDLENRVSTLLERNKVLQAEEKQLSNKLYNLKATNPLLVQRQGKHELMQARSRLSEARQKHADFMQKFSARYEALLEKIDRDRYAEQLKEIERLLNQNDSLFGGAQHEE